MNLYDADINGEVTVISNDLHNIGFTAAVNEGIKNSDRDYVWLLNSDTVVLPGALDALIKRMDADETCGIVGSMQVDPVDHDTIHHGGTSQAYPYGVHRGGKLSAGDCRLPEKQTWVNFASVLLRRKMINEIGTLDENYFMYYSDSDYCYTARLNNWTVWYEPESKVLHRLGSSANPNKIVLEKDKKHFENKWLTHDNFQKLDKLP
jgi:GT2 family glycosyltransferase